MSKMQKVRFLTVDEFLEFLPDHERNIVEILRQIVQECMPEAREKLSYNVPYYWLKKRVCYIWPSSVPWGKVQRHGVLLGFCRGQHIPDDIGYLNKGERKEVASKTFLREQDIDADLLRSYLYAAVLADQESA